MALEIERKFLIKNDNWREKFHSEARLKQGYLTRGPERSVRVRTKGNGKAYLNMKGSTDGITRREFEYEIPLHEAEEILEHLALRPFIDKTRYEVRHGGHLWEIDVFHGENDGLVVAEVELAHAEEAFERPDWLGEEVSGDPRYYNMNLIDHPFCEWQD